LQKWTWRGYVVYWFVPVVGVASSVVLAVCTAGTSLPATYAAYVSTSVVSGGAAVVGGAGHLGNIVSIDKLKRRITNLNRFLELADKRFTQYKKMDPLNIYKTFMTGEGSLYNCKNVSNPVLDAVKKMENSAEAKAEQHKNEQALPLMKAFRCT
jgi:hypothetical protein